TKPLRTLMMTSSAKSLDPMSKEISGTMVSVKPGSHSIIWVRTSLVTFMVYMACSLLVSTKGKTASILSVTSNLGLMGKVIAEVDQMLATLSKILSLSSDQTTCMNLG